jgi:hypothetical protein
MKKALLFTSILTGILAFSASAEVVAPSEQYKDYQRLRMAAALNEAASYGGVIESTINDSVNLTLDEPSLIRFERHLVRIISSLPSDVSSMSMTIYKSPSVGNHLDFVEKVTPSFSNVKVVIEPNLCNENDSECEVIKLHIY